MPSPTPMLPEPPPAKPVAWHNAFITGLLLLAPLGVSVLVVNFLIKNVGDPASSVFFGWMHSEPTTGVSKYLYEILSTFIVLVFITALGYTSHYFFGRWLLRWTESLVTRLPFVGQVYRTTKQIVDTFHSQKAAFQKIVLIQFPREGLYSVGFVTNPVQGEVRLRTGEEFVNVFIPTTPNPTSGFLVMCRASELIELEMSVGDGMKLLISGGTIVPPFSPAVPPKPVS